MGGLKGGLFFGRKGEVEGNSLPCPSLFVSGTTQALAWREKLVAQPTHDWYTTLYITLSFVCHSAK